MHEAAAQLVAQHRTPLISPISLQSKRKLGLISLNRCGIVGVGLGASLKGENQIWSEKRILLYFQIITPSHKFMAGILQVTSSPVTDNLSQTSPPSTQQENYYRRLRGLKYHENRLRILTYVYKGVTTRIIGQTFNLNCSPEYNRWLETTCHNWSPIVPTFDLVSQDSNLSQNQDQSQFDQIPPATSADMPISTNAPRSLPDLTERQNVSEQSQLSNMSF